MDATAEIAQQPCGEAVGGEMLLELVDISVRYGAVRALEEVSLGVRRGELVAVMGPNGAGKSTVLKAIMGLAASRRAGRSTCGASRCPSPRTKS